MSMGALGGTVPDLMVEPISGSLLPVVLEDDSSCRPSLLLGAGVRVKRFAVIDVQIYVLSVYGQHDEIFGESEVDDNGMPVSPPVTSRMSADQLMHRLLSSPAEKVLCLTFLRSITGKQAFDGLVEGLVKIGGAPKEEVEELKNHIPLQIPKASELRFAVKPQLGEVRFSCSVVPDGERSFTLPGVCEGIHKVYFGPDSIVQGLGTSLLHQRPIHAARNRMDRCNSGQSDSLSSTAGSVSHLESDSGESPARARIQACPETECGLATISSGVELNFLAKGKQGTTSASSEAAAHLNACNPHGAYDSAALVKACLKQTSQILPGEVEPWPGAMRISVEESVAPWIVYPDVSDYDDEKLRSQNIQGIFYKHHTSSLRGALAPKWTTRHYELQSGVLRYRRRVGGKYCGDVSLDGARVVAEGPKVSRLGECFIFKVIVNHTTAVTLSSPDKSLATEWVHAVAGACAFYRARRCIAAGVLFAHGDSGGSSKGSASEPPGTSFSVDNSASSEGSQQQRQVQAAQQLPVSSAAPLDPKHLVVAVSFSEGSQQQRQVQAPRQGALSSFGFGDPRMMLAAVTPQRVLPWRRIGLSILSTLLVLLLARRRRRVQR